MTRDKLRLSILFLCLWNINGSESSVADEIHRGNLVFRARNGNKGDCELEISFGDLRLICHTAEKPVLSLGHGEFQALENLGNFELNDTLVEGPVALTEFEMTADGVSFFNTEAGLGVDLVIKELEDLGLMAVDLVFPDKWRPEVEKVNRVWLSLYAEETEMVWGGGEQYTYLNLRGRNYPIWVREQGVGRNKSTSLTQIIDQLSGGGGDYHTTYWPQSSFLSSRRYYMESTYPTYHDLDFTQADRHTIHWHMTVPDNSEGSICLTCHLNFLVKSNLMDVVKALNPGQPALPEWVYNGAIIGVQGGTDRMLEVLDQAEAQGVKVAGLWIQDWSGKITTQFGTRVFWNWRWNETWYPDLDVVIADLAERRNVRVTAYITPHLNVDGDVYGNYSAEDTYWLTTASDGERLLQDFGEFTVATVDVLEHPPDCNCLNTARIWYKQLIKENMIDLGFSGWMADFGEYTPIEARSNFGDRWWGSPEEQGEILHQVLSEEWAKLNREVVEETGNLGEIMFWMRSGGIRSKYHQVMSWAGDQTVDWTQSDGLPSSIVSALSLAVSGMGLTHSDIGGYTGTHLLSIIRSKELLLRWAEYAAFTPIMRTHEGNEPEYNHQVYSDEETLQAFGRLTQIYVALSNYTRAAVKQNTDEHVPVMRPLFLQFEDDPESFLQEYEYMYGDDLLVSPVLVPGVESWQVYLPGLETEWVHLWTGETFPGNSFSDVRAPLGEPPVFYVKGSDWEDLFVDIGNMFKL